MALRTAAANPLSFPLWLHSGKGFSAKKIRGRMCYFGKNKDAALAEYVHTQSDLEVGRTPRPKDAKDLTLCAS
ncbi:MAG TPA: hypothetical protein VGJ05_22680 [Fimbriiglobus sp.]|jgi:hypothetical protein